MPQPDTEIDLDVLMAAIQQSLSLAFPAFALVEAYAENRRNMPTPSCMIELLELEPAANPGTEQLAVVARFEASVVVGFRDAAAKLRAAKMAAAVAHHIQGKRWGLPVEPAIIETIAPSDFDPELDQFEVWAVEWQQTIHIGASVWGDEGAPPSQVLAAWSPDIGTAHEAGYRDISQVTA